MRFPGLGPHPRSTSGCESNARINAIAPATVKPWNRRQSEYIKARPEIAYVAQERRRARKAAAPHNDLTRKQWRAIKAAFGNRCAYCGQHFERLTMDHIVALSKGRKPHRRQRRASLPLVQLSEVDPSYPPTFLPSDPEYLLKLA